MSTAAEVQSAQAKLRTWLLVAAASVTVFGFFHHVDHVGPRQPLWLAI